MVFVPPDLPAQVPPVGSATTLTQGDCASGSATDLPARLENAARRSIEEIDHILGLPLDREHPQYAAELRAKTSVINTTLATQARVDDLRLKRQVGQDLLPVLMARMEEAMKNPKLFPPVDEGPAVQTSASDVETPNHSPEP